MDYIFFIFVISAGCEILSGHGREGLALELPGKAFPILELRQKPA
jgi:hypothetical protein